MKQRFSYLDLRLVVNELERELVNCRLQNIYSLEGSSRHFLLKFDGKDSKTFMMADPGFRVHLTRYQHATTPTPSGFVAKLRKHLRTRRVTKFWVAPGSRLLVLTFSDGLYHLVFEFFAGGNMILLDENFKVMIVQRVVSGTDSRNRCAVGEQYPLNFEQPANPQQVSLELIQSWIGKQKLGKVIYSHISDPSSSMIEYCLTKHGIDPKSDQGDPEQIHAAITEAVEWAHKLMANDTNEGYILKKDDGSSLEFEPFEEYFEQEQQKNSTLKVTSLDTYNKTVDEYFGALLSDTQVSRVEQLHKVAEQRLAAARSEKDKRVNSLEQIEERNEQCGKALQANAELVDNAIQAVRQLVENGSDWGDIDNLIKIEKQQGNYVARRISKLDLEHDEITLRLPTETWDESDSEDEDGLESGADGREDASSTISVKVKLGKTSWANARDYFDVRRAAGAKKDKTIEHAQKAYKSAEHKIKRDLEKNLAKSSSTNKTLHEYRPPYWFEKFYWFLASDGLLVIGGRDSLQNELLLRRYFEKNDVLVHSDVDGAAVLIIKNPTGGELSPRALAQAAAFCVATSARAWERNMPAPSWYLTRGDVPKVNEAGEPTSVADLSRLKRTMMFPTPIDMGMTILWKTEGVEEKMEALEVDSDEDFPDTQVDSDDEFPDTQVDSDDELPDTQIDSEDDLSESREPTTEPSVDPSAEHSAEESGQPSAEPTPDAESTEIATGDQSEGGPSESHSGLKGESSEPQDASVSKHESSETQSEPKAQTESAEDESDTPSLALGPSGARVRGKAKKLKKLKKYADQDEEERDAAMQRLGTLKGLARQEQEKKDKEERRKAQQDAQKRRQQRARQAELDRIASEVVEETPLPSNLLSVPPPDDQGVIAAVPMFAPWSALQKAKFRVKLIPGQVKKGKATQEVLRVITTSKETPPSEREKQLMDAIRPQDMQLVMAVTKVQLAAGGARSTKSATKGAGNRGSKAKKKK